MKNHSVTQPFFYLIVLAILLPAPSVYADTELLRMRRTESSEKVQLYLIFNESPQYSKVVKGRRIDIVLHAVVQIAEGVDLAADEQIVKFLTQIENNETILTFFLRYEPQNVEVTTPQTNILVLDILLGNQFTKAYPDLSSKLQGLTVVQQKIDDFTNPYLLSPYVENWQSFFSRYEPEISTTARVNFTIPPFPVINLLSSTAIETATLLPGELFTLAQNDFWPEMLPILEDLLNNEQDFEIKKMTALSYGEALFRSGNYEGAFKQLYLLKESYREEPVGIIAGYLLVLLRASYENPYIADSELRYLTEYADEGLPISPYIYITQLETALATKQMDKMNRLLAKDTIALPKNLINVKELRQADFWFAGDDYLKAYVGYTLVEEEGLLDKYPSSLNSYADTLYRQKKYERAATFYQKLMDVTNDQNSLATIALKKAMAEGHFKNNREMYAIYATLEDTYPETAAGFRAAIKKTDIRYLSQPNWKKTSLQYYKAIAESASAREVAEEAALKEAIVYSEMGDNATSIELLMDFIREFRNGNLQMHGLALLIEILPAEIEKLLSEKKFIEALVLAKKNRDLFQKNWLDVEILSRLAKAYYELGVFEEAANLYLFLLNTNDPAVNEQYYIPLISIHYWQGRYDTVEDYAAQYNYIFPDGRYQHQIFLIRLKSLIANNKNNTALQLLTTSIPDDKEIKEVAAMLFFRENLYEKTIDVLLPYYREGTLNSLDSQFILAESLFQADRFDTAEEVFHKVRNEQAFFDQSLYRLAKIEEEKGSQENALKLLHEIVEKGSDPLWQKLAEKELQFHELEKKY